ncbi:MAG: hypothetical protein IJ313_00600 [Clostridia bacterium]|nr:hypothetical protein [Clostridia bacterium]
MTPSQTRAMRAKQLLDSGREPAEVARELGYTKVSAMSGAISLCSRAIEREEKKMLEICRETSRIDLLAEGPALIADKRADDISACEKPKSTMAAMIHEEHQEAHFYPRTSPVAHLYPVENGIVTIGKALCSVTYKPDVGTAFINLKSYRKWMPLYRNLLGGSEGLASTLRQIAEAATEAAALIEEENYVDHHK